MFERNLAFVIGINNYLNGIPPLKTAVNDAKKLVEVLRCKHGYQVWVCLDEVATLTNLNKLLEKTLPQEVTENDRLLFYFAGHGVALNGDDGLDGYLVPQDAVGGDTNSYLPMTKLHDALTQLPCRHFLGILDCCFAGAFRWSTTRDLLTSPEIIHKERYDRYITDAAWQIITSSASDQKALDNFNLDTDKRGQVGNHSPFATALLEALEGAADVYPPPINSKAAGDGVITATELYLYLRDRVEIPTEKYRLRQTPGIWCLNKHDKGEYIFLSPGHELNLPPAPPLDESKNPYRGLQAFEEEHSELFFGRQALIEQLYQKVCQQPLTVVLGASGTGKSSLVKAGLIPYIKQLNSQKNVEMLGVTSLQQQWYILAPMRPGESPLKVLNNTLAADNLLVQGLHTENVNVVRQGGFGISPSRAMSEGEPQSCSSLQERLLLAQRLPMRNHKQNIGAQERVIPEMRKSGTSSPNLRQFKHQIPAKEWVSSIVNIEHNIGAWLQQNPQSKLLLVIDQTEELLTLCPHEQERKDFLELLCKLVTDYSEYLRIVLTLRSDFEPQLSNSALEPCWYSSRFIVPAMTREELRTCIEEPASARVMYFEPHSLVEQLIDEVAQMPGALPLLSFTLSELYVKYLKSVRLGTRDDRAITQADYEQLGGVNRSLTQRADYEYDNLVKKNMGYVSTIRKVMLRMIAVGGGELARRRVLLSELEFPEPENTRTKEVIACFTDARLLVKGQNTEGKPYVEAAHDTLVRGWQKLLLWKQNEEENLILQRRLTPAAQEWKNKQQRRFLWNGNPRLDLLKTILHSDDNWLNNVEAEFIKRSIGYRENNRRIRMGLIAIAFAFVSGLSLFFWNQAQQVQSENLARSSQRSFDLGQELDGLIEALKAGKTLKWTLWAEVDARIPVITALNQTVYGVREYNRFQSHNAEVNSICFNTDDKTITSASSDGTIIHSSKQGKEIGNKFFGFKIKTSVEDSEVKVFPQSSNNKITTKFSRDCKTIVLQGQRGAERSRKRNNYNNSSKIKTTKVLKLDGKELLTLQHDNDSFTVSSLSPDGKILALGGNDGRIILWSTEGNSKQPQVMEHNPEAGDKNARIHSISFSPDGKKIASMNRDGIIKLWNLSGKQIMMFSPEVSRSNSLSFGTNVNSLSFSPDGKILASGSHNGKIILWSLTNKNKRRKISINPNLRNLIHRNTRRQIISSNEKIKDISFSSDGKTIAVLTDDNTIKVWKTANGRKLTTIQAQGYGDSFSGSVNTLSFSPDSKTLATGNENGSIKLWDWEVMQPKFLSPRELLNDFDFSPDSKSIALAGLQYFKIYNLDNGKYRTIKAAPNSPGSESTGMVNSVSFSPDNKNLATSANGIIQLWSLEDGKEIWKFPESGEYYGPSRRVRFSPDGQTLMDEQSDSPFLSVDGKDIGRSSKPNRAIRPLRSSPNGKIQVYSRRNIIEFRRLTDKKQIFPKGEEALLEQKWLRNISFSPDSKKIAWVIRNVTIQFWDWGKNDPVQTLNGHTGDINSISFDRDGEVIVSASEDGTIKLWKTADSTEITSINRFNVDLDGSKQRNVKFTPNELKFSPDGKFLAVGGKQSTGTVILLNFDLDDLLQRGCDRVRDYLKNNPNVEESDRHLCG